MSFLSAVLRVLPCCALLAPLLSAEEIGPFTGPAADAEAARLAERAGSYVRNVVEGQYSYAYIQFYWKRAGANFDRILTAYPTSPTARRILAGELGVGPFPAPYFKQRVLPRLEEKKVAAFDAVNCAIFLYNLEDNRDPAGRQQLLGTILQTLCRQIRWSEALSYPVLDAERPWLWEQVARQAALYHNDKLVAELLANMTEAGLPRIQAAVAEALAFRGDTAEELEAYLTRCGPTALLRLAAFRGLARRELPITRALEQRAPLTGLYAGVDGVQRPDRRTDLRAIHSSLPAEVRAAADEVLATYLAGLGRWPEATALSRAPAVTAAYLEFLVLRERYDEAVALARDATPDPDSALPYGQLLIALEQAGRAPEAAALRTWLARRLGAAPAAYGEARSRILATEPQLVVREHYFAELPLADPNLLGRLVCEWSLTPNRSLRGAAPWDAIVSKFAPGYANLPEPKDRKKVEAAGR